MKEFLDAFQKKNPDAQPIQNGSVYGWAAAKIMNRLLEDSCDNLTREGVQNALRGLTDYSDGTVAGTLDYSDPAVPPSRSNFIMKATAAVPGGLTVEAEPFESDLAKQYTFDK